jgi:hypothetical protein
LPRTHLFAHFLPPLVIAFAGLALGLRSDPLTVSALTVYLLGAGLFYAAPYILWAGLVLLLKPKRSVCHAGFFLCTGSLLAVGALSFARQDPSGLPYQWLVYWPLAGLLLLMLLIFWLFSGRPRADA